MKERVLKLLLNNNIQPDMDSLNYIITKQEPISFVNKILKNDNLPMFLSLLELKKVEDKVEKEIVENNIKGKKISNIQEKDLSLQSNKLNDIDNIIKPNKINGEELTFTDINLDPEINLEILKDITGESTTEGKIDDFKKYFNSRFVQLKKIIKTKPEMFGNKSLMSVIKNNRDEEIKVIGIVSNERRTKKGNIMMDFEDDQDRMTCIITSSSEAFNENILVDEVIGLIGKKSAFPGQRNQNFILGEKIIRPDIPIKRKINKSNGNEFVAFISDIHIGSSTFLNEPWNRFINWLSEKNEISKKIKYLIVAGDNVDGIGIYPNQEDELNIFDIYAQYEALSKEFSKIPQDIKIIIQPGNHDAVRPAEPQPALPEQIQQLFDSNIQFVGNPCYFSIQNVEILAYHGRSMDDYITHIRQLNYTNPINSMKEMLKRRHLATVYGVRTPIAPEHRDYLVIDRIPDIFVTGHVHSSGIERFRDILLINASTWQSQTTYQKMLNFSPIPAKVPVVDLQTLNYEVLDFLNS